MLTEDDKYISYLQSKLKSASVDYLGYFDNWEGQRTTFEKGILYPDAEEKLLKGILENQDPNFLQAEKEYEEECANGI